PACMSQASGKNPTATGISSVFDPLPVLVKELDLPPAGIRAVLKLMAEGATGNLDEVQIRAIGERFAYLTEPETRRASVLTEIEKQGKLTPELEQKLRSAGTKAELEDLYLPFKPKRRTRGLIALERGLGPLADALWAQAASGPAAATLAASFVDSAKEVPDVAAA